MTRYQELADDIEASIAAGVLRAGEADDMKRQYVQALESGDVVSRPQAHVQDTRFKINFEPYRKTHWRDPADTSLAHARVLALTEKLTAIPSHYELHKAVRKVYDDRRKMGAGYLQTGYYAGFFLAAALNFTVGASYGWRAMFLCGLAPVVLSFITLAKVQEPPRWKAHEAEARRTHPFVEIFSPKYRARTLTMTALLTVAIIGLWAGAVYEPTAITQLAKKAGIQGPMVPKIVSLGTAVLSIGTILGCIVLPALAERHGRKRTLAMYFAGMAITIPTLFGWAFYLEQGLTPFIAGLFFLGFFGGNFAVFSLWLPELYDTRVRATAFAFATSFGRFVGAGINFLIGSAVLRMGTLGTPVAWTGAAFVLGLLIIPFAVETRGQALPE